MVFSFACPDMFSLKNIKSAREIASVQWEINVTELKHKSGLGVFVQAEAFLHNQGGPHRAFMSRSMQGLPSVSLFFWR